MKLPHWIRCYWSKWSEPVEVKEANEDKPTVGQFSICSVCNAKKYRRVIITN